MNILISLFTIKNSLIDAEIKKKKKKEVIQLTTEGHHNIPHPAIPS